MAGVARMMNCVRAGLVLALIHAPAGGGAALAGPAELRVTDADGARIVVLTLADGDRWCLLWNHSVAGFEVRDCFLARDGEMVLERSHQPDFAAGLGHVPGRGVLHSAPGGGYWIEGIDEIIPGACLPLRVGAPAVDHRLQMNDHEVSLSDLAARQRVRITLVPAHSEGERRC